MTANLLDPTGPLSVALFSLSVGVEADSLLEKARNRARLPPPAVAATTGGGAASSHRVRRAPFAHQSESCKSCRPRQIGKIAIARSRLARGSLYGVARPLEK